MITSFKSVSLVAVAALVLAAYGCGGGGGGESLESGGSGQSPAVRYSINTGLYPPLPDISVIHLELADGATVVKVGGQSIQTDEGVIPVGAGSIMRNKYVCPGIPPRGNECAIREREINGVDYRYFEDWSFDVVQLVLRDTSYSGGSFYGMNIISDNSLPFLSYGGIGEHSAFFSGSNYDAIHSSAFSGAFGNLYSGLPTEAQGSATWRGAMTAYQRLSPEAGEIDGASSLSYDFAFATVDLTLDPQGGAIPSSVPDIITWSDLQVNDDGSFYIVGHGNHNISSDPHPTLGYVDGDFYGPNAEEMAGVFERYGLVGAFGGKRE